MFVSCEFGLKGDSSITYHRLNPCFVERRKDWGERGYVQHFLMIPTVASSFMVRQILTAFKPIWFTIGSWAFSSFLSVWAVTAHAAMFDQIAASLLVSCQCCRSWGCCDVEHVWLQRCHDSVERRWGDTENLQGSNLLLLRIVVDHVVGVVGDQTSPCNHISVHGSEPVILFVFPFRQLHSHDVYRRTYTLALSFPLIPDSNLFSNPISTSAGSCNSSQRFLNILSLVSWW